jgi:hypothetical protein
MRRSFLDGLLLFSQLATKVMCTSPGKTATASVLSDEHFDSQVIKSALGQKVSATFSFCLFSDIQAKNIVSASAMIVLNDCGVTFCTTFCAFSAPNVTFQAVSLHMVVGIMVGPENQEYLRICKTTVTNASPGTGRGCFRSLYTDVYELNITSSKFPFSCFIEGSVFHWKHLIFANCVDMTYVLDAEVPQDYICTISDSLFLDVLPQDPEDDMIFLFWLNMDSRVEFSRICFFNCGNTIISDAAGFLVWEGIVLSNCYFDVEPEWPFNFGVDDCHTKASECPYYPKSPVTQTAAVKEIKYGVIGREEIVIRMNT